MTDINDVRYTSTLAKFEEAVRRSSPVTIDPDIRRKERIAMAREICLQRGENPNTVDRGGNEGWEKYEPLAGACIREAERIFALRSRDEAATLLDPCPYAIDGCVLENQEVGPCLCVNPVRGAAQTERTWDVAMSERVMQLEAAGAKNLSISAILGLISFVRDGEGSPLSSTDRLPVVTKGLEPDPNSASGYSLTRPHRGGDNAGSR